MSAETIYGICLLFGNVALIMIYLFVYSKKKASYYEEAGNIPFYEEDKSDHE